MVISAAYTKRQAIKSIFSKFNAKGLEQQQEAQDDQQQQQQQENLQDQQEGQKLSQKEKLDKALEVLKGNIPKNAKVEVKGDLVFVTYPSGSLAPMDQGNKTKKLKKSLQEEYSKFDIKFKSKE